MNILCHDTRYGPIVYNRNDPFFSKAIETYGEWSWSEVTCWQIVIPPGSVVVSAGANIGLHVVALAQLVGKQGAVIAFEPQRAMYHLAIANTVLCNVDERVRLHHAALGAAVGKISVPAIDYAAADNSYGGLSLRHTEVPADAPRYDVPLIPIDALNLSRVDFIQLDIEGMEGEALKGAEQTIRRCQPLLYIETSYVAHNRALHEQITSMGYNAVWHLAPMVNPSNYRGNTEDLWPGTVSISWLCAPTGVDLGALGLPPVTDPEHHGATQFVQTSEVA